LVKLFLNHENFQKIYRLIDFSNLEIAKLCVESGKFEINDIFSLACHHGKIETVKYFLENSAAGLDLKKRDPYRNTPFRIACYLGSCEIVSLLLNCNLEIDINQRDEYGQTPLWIACVGGDFEIVDLLLEDSRIQVNQQDEYYRTELFAAAEFGQEQIVKHLLASSFDIDVTIRGVYWDWSNLTAAEIARRYNHPKIADLIDEYEKTPRKVRAALRKELKLNARDAARLLANVVLLSDDYLSFKQSEDQPLNQQIRFYHILIQFPLELQTRVCNITFEHNSFFIFSKDFELALKKTIKAFI